MVNFDFIGTLKLKKKKKDLHTATEVEQTHALLSFCYIAPVLLQT